MRLITLRKTHQKYVEEKAKKKDSKYYDWVNYPFPEFDDHTQNLGLGKKLKIFVFSSWL